MELVVGVELVDIGGVVREIFISIVRDPRFLGCDFHSKSTIIVGTRRMHVMIDSTHSDIVGSMPSNAAKLR